MAKEKNIEKKLKHFVREIKNNIKVKSIYFFGSYISGKKKYNDIDVAIISDDFSGFKFDDRKKLNPFILKSDINIEIHPFTLKEFQEKDPFLNEIIRTGKKIA